MKHLELYVQNIIFKNENFGLSTCMKYSFTMIDLVNVLKFKRLMQLLEINRLLDGIINICFEILDNYGTEIDEFKTEAKNINEYLSLFVLTVLEDTFKNNKAARQKIISRLLDKILEHDETTSKSFIVIESVKKIYLDQFHHLINSSSFMKFYFDLVNLEESSDINKSIMNRFNDYYTSKISQNKLNFYSDSSELFDFNMRLLNSIGLLIFASNKSNEDSFYSLILFFKKHSSIQEKLDKHSSEKNNNVSVEFSLFALVNIIKSLNSNHANYQNENDLFFNNDYKKLRTQYLKDSSNASIIILDHLSKVLNYRNIQSSFKSTIYQSFSFLVKSNLNLAPYIIDFLFVKLDNLIIIYQKENLNSTKYIEKHGGFSENNQDDLIYFDFDKIFNSLDPLVNFEPIDIIFHCIDLCTRLVTKSQQIQSINIPSLTKINLLLKTIFKTYVKKDSKFFFELYNNQLKNKYQFNASFLQIIHQLQIGILDVLIEHAIENDQFDCLEMFVIKHEETELLFCSEIENIIQCKNNQFIKPLGNNMKRKLETSKQTTSKKYRLNTKEDKENFVINQRLNNKNTKLSKREPFSLKQNDSYLNQDNSTPTVSDKTDSPEDNNSSKQFLLDMPGTNIPFLNMKFERTPRISYTCCLKIIQICICSNDVGIIKTSKLINDVNLLKILIQLISSEKFNQYVIKLISFKLSSISNFKFNEIYDPESYGLHELFNFLSILWVIFCQRINGPDLLDISLFKTNTVQRFSQSFYNQTNQYIEFCLTIWKIVNKQFKKKRDDLIRNERKYYASNDNDLWFGLNSNNLQKKIRVYWKFLLCCSHNIKMHLSPFTGDRQIAVKIINSMLSLMYEILKSIKLNDKHYEIFIEWLYELSSFDLVSDKDTSLLILDLFNYVTYKSTLNSIPIKYFSVDYSNFILNINRSLNEINLKKTILNFNFLNNENFKFHEQALHERIIKFINNFNFALENLKYYDQNKLIKLIIIELDNIILSLSYLFKSVSDEKSSLLMLKLLIEFYNFLQKFIAKNFKDEISNELIFMLKKLIDSINYNVQSKLQSELNRIKNFLINNDHEIKFQEIKANNDEIINIIKNKKFFIELINSINIFESEIIRVNNMISSKHIYLIENYTFFIKNLQLNFDTRMTRTVSPNQLNKILQEI